MLRRALALTAAACVVLIPAFAAAQGPVHAGARLRMSATSPLLLIKCLDVAMPVVLISERTDVESLGSSTSIRFPGYIPVILIFQ